MTPISMKTIPFKKIMLNVIDHPVEKRGFVTVPFDDADPKSGNIDIFYRLIPAYGSTVADSTKPIIVVFNGGPGVPASIYRQLDFDYSHLDAPSPGAFDRFKYLLKTHRILLVDQRGTDGQSAPIDMENPGLDASLVARFFSSDSQARDYLAVINAIIPTHEPFFILAQSYGGMPGMQYLSLPNIRRPNGILFSCSGLPYENFMEQMFCRRREQLRLNLQLRETVPDIGIKLKRVSCHLEKLGIDPIQLHGFYAGLGQGLNGIWEKVLASKLEKILEQNREEIAKESLEKVGEVNLLNSILSSANFTPGQTDRSIARITSAQLPFEPWMLDENQIYLKAGQDGYWRRSLLDTIDRNPPQATPFATVDKLRSCIAQNQLLFTTAENDAFVPADAFQKAIEKFLVPGHAQVQHLPGGHHAIFLEEGHRAFLNWSNDKI